jgi:hypothetical protein
MAAAAARALQSLLPTLPSLPLLRSSQACCRHIEALTNKSQRHRLASMTPHQAAAAAAEQQQQQPAQPLANPALASSEVLIATTFASKDSWVQYLRRAGLRVRVHPEDTGPGADLSGVEFAICWNPPAGLLQQCPNLKAIQSMGAGVDSMIHEPSLPRHVPLLRVIDPLSERQHSAVLIIRSVKNS